MKKTLTVSTYAAVLLSLLFCALGSALAEPFHVVFLALALFAGLWSAVVLTYCATVSSIG